MNDLLFVFLSLSVSGSILSLILLTLKPLVKNRLSQTWQYYIWLIVILRFLLPFTPQISVVGEMSRQIENIANPPAVVEINPGMVVDKEYTTPQPPDLEALQNTETETLVHPAYWRDILNNVWLLWFGVALIMFVHKVTSYRSFVRFVNAGIEKINDTHILDIYDGELAIAKVKRRLPIYVNNQVVSPMLVGIIRPALIIPILETSDDELRNILRHELTHYKRLDFLYKWITQITLCLHWFNPLVYLINKQINKSCELSCDEAVIRYLDEDGRVSYGDALMVSLKAQGNYSDFVVSMTMSENGNIVKERLDMIMSYKKKSRLMLCASVLLTILLLCGFTFAGAYTVGADYKPLSTTIQANPSQNSAPKTPYFENYSIHPENSISAQSRSNNWSVSDTAAGDTIQTVLDNKLKFIENIWQEEKEPFIIVDGISADGITDTDSLQYLYDNSSIYRDLIAVSDILYIVPEHSFSRLADTGHNPVYERYAFYLQGSAELSLSASYQLETGKMSLIIVSPSGKIAYQNDLTARFDETISVSLEKGISSVVLVYETDAGECDGKINIMGQVK